MIASVSVKAARTRKSSGIEAGEQPQAARFKEEPMARWSPTRISDRKLVELAQRLDRLHRSDDAFAGVTLSPEAYARLQQLPGYVVAA